MFALEMLSRHRKNTTRVCFFCFFFTTVEACGGNDSVCTACHVLSLVFPVWLGWCLHVLMVSQRWVVCDAHPAQPPLTDLRGDNWLLSSITHLAFQMALWDSQAVEVAATWLCLCENTPQRGKRIDYFFCLCGCHFNKNRFHTPSWLYENQFEHL